MNLTELIGVKKYRDLTADQLAKLMHDMTPFKLQGKGAFASAFEKDGKIYKFWLADAGYDKFLEYVEENQDNPCLPKLLSKVKTVTAFFKRPEHAPSKVKYVQLEKLLPVTTQHPVRINDGRDADVPSKLDLAGVLHAVKGASMHKGSKKTKVELVVNAIADECDDAPVNDKQLMSFIKTWFDIQDGTGHDMLDASSRNVMKRANGELVIIDPVADKEDWDFNQWLKRFNNEAKDNPEGHTRDV